MEESRILALIAISVFAAAVLGLRYNVYTVFLELVAGFILGNLLHYTLPEQILFISEIGLISLMFMAGMEVDFETFKSKWKDSVRLGSLAYVIPFAAIFALGFFLFDQRETALLMAIALVPASAGVVYTILVQKGPLGTRRKMILASVMVTDIASMILLGVFFSRFSYFTILLFGIVILSFFILPKVGSYLSSISGKEIVNIEIKFALAVVLLSEFFADLAGVDGVLVAFLFGMAFSEIFAGSTKGDRSSEEKLQAIVFGFLTPIFFFVTGYMISAAAFVRWWYLIIFVVAFTFFVKWVTVYAIGKKIFPQRIKQVAMIFNTPLSIGIVTVGVGIREGVLPPEQGSILMLVVIISSFIGVMFTRYPAFSSAQTAEAAGKE